MAFSDESAHQRSLLAAHLRRLMAIDEQLARKPGDVTLRMERDQTATNAEQAAARLGLGTLRDNLAAIIDAAGLRAGYIISLQRQQQLLENYQHAAELQRISADAVVRIDLDQAIHSAGERLEQIGQQLGGLGAASTAKGISAGSPPALPSHVHSSPTSGIAPERSTQLRQALLDCEEYFGSHSALRSLFSDARLAPWRGGLPEAGSLRERVDLTIAYLHDKSNMSGEAALPLLIAILQERYDPSDARHATLLALLQTLLEQSSVRPLTSASSPEATMTESGRRAPMLAIAEAQLMLGRATAVAQVSIGKFVDGRRGGVPTGTAWLVAPTLALTCWHVVHARGPNDREVEPQDLDEQIRKCVLTFDFVQAGGGVEYGVARLEHAYRDDTRHDYALLRLRDRSDAPLARATPLPLDLGAPLTSLTDLFIIQHPGGQPQQQSNGTFERAHPDKPERILYTNRTEAGTSGAPVFNRTGWRVVALHHGMNDASRLGEGILLRAICDDLRRQHPDLFEEIMRAQPT